MKLTDKERALCLKYAEAKGEGTFFCKEWDCDTNCPIGRAKTELCSKRVAYETAVKLLNEDERNNNMSEQLTITKEKVLKAAAKCSTAKEVLKTIFPEVFEEDKYFNLSELSETDTSNSVIFNSEKAKRAGFEDKYFMQIADASTNLYKHKAFFLSRDYNWQLIDADADYTGVKLLIPTKK